MFWFFILSFIMIFNTNLSVLLWKTHDLFSSRFVRVQAPFVWRCPCYFFPYIRVFSCAKRICKAGHIIPILLSFSCQFPSSFRFQGWSFCQGIGIRSLRVSSSITIPNHGFLVAASLQMTFVFFLFSVALPFRRRAWYHRQISDILVSPLIWSPASTSTLLNISFQQQWIWLGKCATLSDSFTECKSAYPVCSGLWSSFSVGFFKYICDHMFSIPL